jgi:orotate phosphoribosyltransferase
MNHYKNTNMNDIIEILKKAEAFISNGHFVGTSGLHFDTYINKDALYMHTEATSKVCEFFAEKYKDEKIDVVVAPAIGGIILSQWTANHLTKINESTSEKEVLGVYTEKKLGGGQEFTRGYDQVVQGKRVLVVEDLVTTGGSVKKVIDAVHKAGGEVVAACVMVNRNPAEVIGEMMGALFDSLAEYPVISYTPADCPMCAAGISIDTRVGHGKKKS